MKSKRLTGAKPLNITRIKIQAIKTRKLNSKRLTRLTRSSQTRTSVRPTIALVMPVSVERGLVREGPVASAGSEALSRAKSILAIFWGIFLAAKLSEEALGAAAAPRAAKTS